MYCSVCTWPILTFIRRITNEFNRAPIPVFLDGDCSARVKCAHIATPIRTWFVAVFQCTVFSGSISAALKGSAFKETIE